MRVRPCAYYVSLQFVCWAEVIQVQHCMKLVVARLVACGRIKQREELTHCAADICIGLNCFGRLGWPHGHQVAWLALKVQLRQVALHTRLLAVQCCAV